MNNLNLRKNIFFSTRKGGRSPPSPPPPMDPPLRFMGLVLHKILNEQIITLSIVAIRELLWNIKKMQIQYSSTPLYDEQEFSQKNYNAKRNNFYLM